MENIIPRWEWRTFGNNFGEAEKNIRNYDITGIDDKGSIYLILQETDRGQAEIVCQHHKNELLRAFECLIVSYVMAMYPADGDSAEALLKIISGE